MKASWVAKENYHLTLRFLGDIDPALTVELNHLCRKVAERVEPFECILDRLGAFPTVDRPRVLWYGGEAPANLRRLTSALSRGLAELGFPSTKTDPIAHITLARIKDHPDPPLANIIDAFGSIKPMRLNVDRIVLMESMLSPQGAIYTPLFTTKLGAFR